MKIVCFSPFGFEGSLVSIEVDLRRGIPAIDIVGLADGAIKESRERMRSAIVNSGLAFPPERVLISLSPADLKKEGAGFDLAVALSVLHAKDNLDKEPGITDEETVLVMGELELNGNIRPVRAVNAAASTAAALGITMCIVPVANAEEARAVKGMKVYGANRLLEAYTAMNSPDSFTRQGELKDFPNEPFQQPYEMVEGVAFAPINPEQEMSHVSGQEHLIRGLQIAAAGGHNLLAYGPPGCGKTLSLQKYPSLVPLLDQEKSQTVTRIYSVAGLMPSNKSSIIIPPFRQPHQTASIEGICGGGPHCTPGEISLAHGGILFLDEAAEFKSSVLQMLRVPLESGRITLSRAGRSTTYPADFQLLMSTNPCPCGNYGSKEKICLCSAHAVESYWKKFSGPLLDRIDLRIQVDNNSGLNTIEHNGVSTAELRVKIARAVKIQQLRQGKKNVKLTPEETGLYCILEKEAQKILDEASVKNDFSQRAYSGTIKLARTIADMEEKENIDTACILEAVSYRKAGGIIM